MELLLGESSNNGVARQRLVCACGTLSESHNQVPACTLDNRVSMLQHPIRENPCLLNYRTAAVIVLVKKPKQADWALSDTGHNFRSTMILILQLVFLHQESAPIHACTIVQVGHCKLATPSERSVHTS